MIGDIHLSRAPGEPGWFFLTDPCILGRLLYHKVL
jgi:hypothetical protein